MVLLSIFTTWYSSSFDPCTQLRRINLPRGRLVEMESAEASSNAVSESQTNPLSNRVQRKTF
uniref:Uncharacterized protein n=1 Tax=Utricularia reniformis TaxID=192314 RepID=A0A1Y0B0Y2_9LAMI|nr:hypothetical protein AEK19_MT0799 [Utricularia reniformis]ART31038.1 hypothetical protein AEK19_MT0799 [Utricularia reniformis]